MKMSSGSKAIDFSVTDVLGNTISLNAYQGKRVLLSFYRYASCPLCNLRVHQLTQANEQLKNLNIELIAVFQSPIERIKEYVGTQNVPFPIVADPEEKLYKLYGVKTSLWKTFKGMMKLNKLKEARQQGFKVGKSDGPISRVPADFLLNEDLNVEIAYYGKDIGDHLPIQEILDQFKK